MLFHHHRLSDLLFRPSFWASTEFAVQDQILEVLIFSPDSFSVGSRSLPPCSRSQRSDVQGLSDVLKDPSRQLEKTANVAFILDEIQASLSQRQTEWSLSSRAAARRLCLAQRI
jgi:hypothetical protein